MPRQKTKKLTPAQIKQEKLEFNDKKEEEVQVAVKRVQSQGWSLRKAVEGIEGGTLGLLRSRLADKQPLYLFNKGKSNLNEAQSRAVEHWILNQEAEHNACSYQELRIKAEQLMNYNINGNTWKTLGVSWCYRFIRDSTLIQSYWSRGASTAKAYALTPEALNEYFDNVSAYTMTIEI